MELYMLEEHVICGNTVRCLCDIKQRSCWHMRLIFCCSLSNNNEWRSAPSLHTDWWTHHASSVMDNWVVSVGDSAAGVNLQPPTCVEVNSEWTIPPVNYTSTPTYAFIACAGTNFYLLRKIKFCMKLEYMLGTNSIRFSLH